MKRLFDIVFATIGLVVLMPLLVLLILAILLDSPGPPFFRQERVGLRGHRFKLWKFRTMRIGQEGPMLTQKADRRVTRVGRLLRRYRLDEIPQLFNVLAGDMSLVGPRPELPQLVEQYTEEERRVLEVRPGITGPTQLIWHDEDSGFPPGADVVRYYTDHIMRPKLRRDLAYAASHSLRGDVQILLKTFLVFLPSFGSAASAHAQGRKK